MLYHGTSTAYLPSIKRYGLKPFPANKYRATNNGAYAEPVDHNGVYLTPNITLAKEFAQFRSDWLRAPIGSIVWFNGVNGKQKLAGDIIPLAKPLLINVSQSVPVNVDDNDNGQRDMLWTDKAIPLASLTFNPLPDTPNKMFFDAGLDGMSLEEYRQEYMAIYFPNAIPFR